MTQLARQTTGMLGVIERAPSRLPGRDAGPRLAMMLRLRGSGFRLRGSLVFVAGAVGFSAPVVDVADANGALTQGLVVVERSLAEGAAPQTNVSAKFMRLSAAADPELAERVVGSTFERPAAGDCLTLDAAADEASGLSALGSV